ncbi:ATP-binding protein, partial [Streptococcus pneumoniae]|nr:ATP-binding protein [Streptococcus pneumoniae]
MKEQFKEFNNRKISDKVCDIHQVNYWEISVPVLGGSERKLQAFCPECV